MFAIPQRISQKILFRNFPLSLPYDVILTPKNALCEHFEQIFADFRLFDHYNNEIILENHGEDCSQCSRDYCKIKFFPKFITILALWRHLDPPKTHFFSIFVKLLPIFAYLITITSKLSYKTMVKIVQIIQEIILK